VFFTSRVELTNYADTKEDENANLYECELVEERGEQKCKLTDLTPENAEGARVLGLVTASEDGSYVYFVAEGKLTNEKNGEGEQAVAGQPNLYLSHGGKVTFIATLAPSVGGKFSGFGNEEKNGDEVDWVGTEGFSSFDFGPGQHAARVTPDGTLLAFESELPLTKYDSQATGAGECAYERCREVYLYDAVTGRLICVSCDPSESSRPVGPAALGGHERLGGGLFAGVEPKPYYLPRNISEGGGRLFFQSSDALVPSDSNGRLNVYEWERPGVGSCTVASATYAAGKEGCIFPISDVAGSSESFFMDASASGDDVFIATGDQLTSSDTDSREDVYDVRVGGGFPVSVPAPVCVNADSCKPPVSPQPEVFGAPASATFAGPGNPAVVPPPPAVVKPNPKTVKCKKSEVRKHNKCVRKKTAKGKKSAKGGR
jgi:hypothetical protein